MITPPMFAADMPAMDTVETGTMQHRSDDTYDEKIDSQDKWYDEMEAIGEIADVSKHVDDHSDISDYEDQLRARKRKKKESVKVGFFFLYLLLFFMLMG